MRRETAAALRATFSGRAVVETACKGGRTIHFLAAHVLVLAALVLAFAPGIVFAHSGEAAGPQIKSVSLGFDGRYKVGYWTPVRITLVGGAQPLEARLELMLPDGDGVRSAIADEQPFMLPPGAEVSLLRYAKFGRVGSEISVTLKDAEGRNLAPSLEVPAGRLPRAAPSTVQLVVTVGREAGVDADVEGRVTALVKDAAALPDRWYGYEGVDTLVFTTGDGLTYRAISDRQIEALDRWVRLGGHLVLCAGASGDALFADPGRFARFAPGKFTGVVHESRTGGLEEYARAGRIDAPQPGGRVSLAMSRLENPVGAVEAHESIRQEVPAVIRAARGFGQITYAAVDLDASPIAGWSGRRRFVARLLETTLRRPEETDESRQSGQVAHIGYRDMTGQLRGALDQFAGVTPFAFSWVAGLIVVYILLIGPADYFFLRKLVRNMAWTWITFPAAVVGCCVLAWYLSSVSRGDSVKINQVDLVDVDVDQQLVRGTSWSHVYSPATQRFDLSLETGAPVDKSASGDASGQLLSWQGLPGDAMGGMNTENAARLFNQPYRISSAALPQEAGSASLTDLPIQVGSSKTLVARWWNESDVGRLDKLVSRRQTGLLRGTFGNPLDVELEDCILYFGSWAYVMDRGLSPRQTITVAELPAPRTLEWHLTRRKVETGGRRRGEVDDDRNLATSWDRSSDDVPRILELMMLHDAAGGTTYTGLGGDYQGFVDLSAHLGLDRAVLVGRVKRPAAQLMRDGRSLADDYDRRWTYYRLVFPVTPEGAAR